MDNRIGVMQVLPNLEIGGAQKTAISFANLLSKHNYQSYLVSAGGVLENTVENKVIRVTGKYQSKSPFRIFLNSFRLKYLIQSYNIKIVHAHSRAPAWSAWLACKMTGATFVTAYHAPYGAKGYFKKFYNSVMLKGVKINIVSKYIEDLIYKTYGKQNHLELIYPEIDTTKYARIKGDRKKFGLKKSDFVIVTTSRFTRLKGNLDLLTAIFLLKEKKRQRIKYLAAGPIEKNSTYFQEMKKLISKLGLKDQVIFSGAYEDARELYAVADCFISSAHKEAFGRTITEAMACEVPSIITNVGAANELIKNEETGFIVPVKYPKRLASKIKKVMLMSSKEKIEMGKKARQHILESFDTEIINQKILDFYYNISKNKN